METATGCLLFPGLFNNELCFCSSFVHIAFPSRASFYHTHDPRRPFTTHRIYLTITDARMEAPPVPITRATLEPDLTTYYLRARPVAILTVAALAYSIPLVPVLLCSIYALYAAYCILADKPVAHEEMETLVGSPLREWRGRLAKDNTQSTEYTQPPRDSFPEIKIHVASPTVTNILSSAPESEAGWYRPVDESAPKDEDEEPVSQPKKSRYESQRGLSLVVNDVPFKAECSYVREATCIRVDRISLQPRVGAVKRFNISKAASDDDEEDLLHLLGNWKEELTIIRKIQDAESPFLCECLGVVLPSMSVEGMLFMPCYSTTMDVYLESHASQFALNSKLRMLVETALGIQALHAMNIVHFDLKPHNVAVDMTSADSHVRIIDFGSALQCENENLLVPSSVAQRHPGTEGYRQRWSREADVVEGRRVDIYSFGVIMWQVLTRHCVPENIKNWDVGDRDVPYARWYWGMDNTISYLMAEYSIVDPLFADWLLDYVLADDGPSPSLEEILMHPLFEDFQDHERLVTNARKDTAKFRAKGQSVLTAEILSRGLADEDWQISGEV
ncbi:kinase-like protein [Cylindrobasidium torrendii FP15055 ss-10]|uniref:Kinase-like protein n=1 Tax=Cylindrobasidium torrendii FP15055 ss-10 TaxID=1314674 RepID=A0A0D7BP15_9AGAR|nr:kinase-like protein [Cylindrobasidium torrendii FP15055 ss-10]